MTAEWPANKATPEAGARRGSLTLIATLAWKVVKTVTPTLCQRLIDAVGRDDEVPLPL